MCQKKETRCFKATKPKTVYKLVFITPKGLQGIYKDYYYEGLKQKNAHIPTKFIKNSTKLGNLTQPGYHCFLTEQDAISTRILLSLLSDIVKCTIPVGSVYRFGIYQITPWDKYRTLRSTDLVIDEILT